MRVAEILVAFAIAVAVACSIAALVLTTRNAPTQPAKPSGVPRWKTREIEMQGMRRFVRKEFVEAKPSIRMMKSSSTRHRRAVATTLRRNGPPVGEKVESVYAAKPHNLVTACLKHKGTHSEVCDRKKDGKCYCRPSMTVAPKKRAKGWAAKLRRI